MLGGTKARVKEQVTNQICFCYSLYDCSNKKKGELFTKENIWVNVLEPEKNFMANILMI
jgi:sialic acid synthase SpsE